MYEVMQNRPHFTCEDAARLAQEFFGKKTQVSLLPSERDQNFHLREDSGAEYVLKIASAAERVEILDFQNRAMTWVGQRGIPCPRVCSNLENADISLASSAEGTHHHVRLLTYLPGHFFAASRPHTRDLLQKLGRFFGRLDRAFTGFAHPAANRELVWDMKIACEVISRCAEHIRDMERRKTVDLFLDRFATHVVPVLPRLRQSVVHNDGNDYNILVGGTRIPDSREIAGIIDFGDMIVSSTAADPAIAGAYALLGKPDPLSAAAHVIGGYHEVFPLTELELEVMFHLICMRLTTSVALSAFQQQREPDNPYLSISEQPAWDALDRLGAIHPRLAHYTLRNACRLEPCPGTSSVVAWLRASEPASVIGPDLVEEPVAVVDLSLESPLETGLFLGTGQNRGDEPPRQPVAQAITNEIGRIIRDAGARVGIGRYNEARLMYTSDSYRVPCNEMPEQRTVHLGIDLFLDPGFPVYAPLPGSVHSFADNDRPLDYGPTVILKHETGEGQEFYTLYGHLTRDSLHPLKPGMRVTRGDRVGAIGHDPENGGWTPHLHFEIIVDLLDRQGEFPGVAAPGQRAVWLSVCPDPNLILKIAGTPQAGLSATEIQEKRRRHIGPNLSVSYRKPLHIVRGYLQHLYDSDGRRYLDAVNNVPHVGHCHPAVVRAANRQTAILNTNTRYLHENIVRYAERLCARLPEPLQVCYFVCSGSEANDLALRLARTHTLRKDVIVLDGAYHGNLTSLIEISPYKFDGPGGCGASPHVHKALLPDTYRGPYKGMTGESGRSYALHVGDQVDRIRRDGRGLAAFISETALSCAGQIILPPGYLREAYQRVREGGGVCIADEVQVGFGRLGSHFWGFEMQAVIPDIVTMGKPIGNGHPLAAVITTREIAASFHNGMEYFNTYGGNPVSCAVGLAVLDVIEGENLQANAWRVGVRLQAGLEALKRKYPLIGDVRGSGLFLGVELVLDREDLRPAAEHATWVIERMKQRGILISTDGPWHNVLKIKPPMVFAEEDADHFVEAFDSVLSETGC
jgi:4-aminobutyrate aminotransferase-like enzyme/Ser/Thr protein kinase RdoA (MazF antagonist)